MTRANLDHKIKSTYVGAVVRPTIAEALRAMADWLEYEEAKISVLAIIGEYEEAGPGQAARVALFWEEL